MNLNRYNHLKGWLYLESFGGKFLDRIISKIKEVHYSWYVAIGSCIMFAFGVGLTTGTFAIFMPPLITEMNLTNTEVSTILSVITTIGLLLMLLVGWISRWITLRKTILFSGISISIGNLIFSFGNNLLDFYIAAIFIGMGYGCCSSITVTALLSRWFTKSRGTAIGIAFSGSGIAIIIMSPILANLIIEHGVRRAFILQGIIVLFAVILTYLLIRDSPKDIGIKPYGGMSQKMMLGDDYSEGINQYNKSPFLTLRFIVLSVASLSLGLSVQPVVSHLASFLITAGYEPSIAMSIVSIYGFSMVIWKTGYGFIMDKIGSKKSNLIFFPLWIISIIFSFTTGNNIIFAYIFLFVIGVGPAIATVSLPIWVVDTFKRGNLNTVTKSIQIITILGSSFGNVLFGYFKDINGNYNIPMVSVILLSIIAFLSINSLYLGYMRSTNGN